MHLSLFQTVSHADHVQGRIHRCLPQSAASTGWIRSRRSTSSSKTWPKALDISSLEFYPLLRSSIYPPVTIHVSHNGCHHSKTKPAIVPINCTPVNKLIICRCQQPSSVAVNNHLLSLSSTIFCHCQQPTSVAVNKLFNCRRSLNQSNFNKPSLKTLP